MLNNYKKLEELNKKLYRANKTIITLCNYLNKCTDNEKALKKANIELVKAKKFIEFENDKEKLLNKIIEFYKKNE